MSQENIAAKPILVQKYGGTSVATIEHIRRVASRVADAHREDRAVVVIVSAMGETTDELVALAGEAAVRPSRREMDMLLHAGEIVSASLLAMAITDAGVPAISVTGQQAGMRTDGDHTRARIRAVRAERVREELAQGRVVVVAGFQGVTDALEITTLGRGGSDTTAVAMAAGLDAESCEILTDVDGVYTADPRIVREARRLEWCSYDEMLELATLGARVLHSRSVEMARRFKVPLVVATSFRRAPGTVIAAGTTRSLGEEPGEDGRSSGTAPDDRSTLEDSRTMEQVSLRGLAHKTDVAKIALVGVPDRPGVAGDVFSALGDAGINISLVVQAEHRGGTNDIAFLVGSEALADLHPKLEELREKIGAEKMLVDENVATVSIVGEGVQREPGVAARMFRTLGGNGINIDLISSSNLMLTCVIPAERIEDALRALHREFFEGEANP